MNKRKHPNVRIFILYTISTSFLLLSIITLINLLPSEQVELAALSLLLLELTPLAILTVILSQLFSQKVWKSGFSSLALAIIFTIYVGFRYPSGHPPAVAYAIMIIPVIVIVGVLSSYNYRLFLNNRKYRRGFLTIVVLVLLTPVLYLFSFGDSCNFNKDATCVATIAYEQDDYSICMKTDYSSCVVKVFKKHLEVVKETGDVSLCQKMNVTNLPIVLEGSIDSYYDSCTCHAFCQGIEGSNWIYLEGDASVVSEFTCKCMDKRLGNVLAVKPTGTRS